MTWRDSFILKPCTHIGEEPIFDGRTLEREDTRRDYGERRVIAIGMAQDIALTLVYTDRAESGGEVVRWIISARVSHRHEREAYKTAIATPQPSEPRPGGSGSTAPDE